MNFPPPLFTRKTRRVSPNPAKATIALAITFTAFLVSIVLLRICGLLNPFIYIPTAAMAPTLSPGDHVVLENFTFLKRKPLRGDIVVFTSDGIKMLQPGMIYNKRIVGQPGEHLQILEGKLYINDRYVLLTNKAGEINYTPTEAMKPYVPYGDVIIPQGQYFVIGDNTTNSLDSRSFGCLPAANIKGRICFCLWPPHRFGQIK